MDKYRLMVSTINLNHVFGKTLMGQGIRRILFQEIVTTIMCYDVIKFKMDSLVCICDNIIFITLVNMSKPREKSAPCDFSIFLLSSYY